MRLSRASRHVNSVKVMLFGLALVCFSGFFVVGQGLGVVSETPVTWGMILGLLLCFLGLLADDERGPTGPATTGTEGPDARGDSGRGEREEGERDDGRDTDDHDTDGDRDTDDDRDDYSPSLFPPM